MSQNYINNLVFGYGYDFWIYCVGQKEIKPESICSKELHCITTYYAGIDTFAFPVCDSYGVFCNFTSSSGEIGGTIFLRENDDQTNDYFNFSWLNQEEKEDIKRMVLREDYKDEIVKAIYNILAQFPVRKVYLYVRCQCLGRNNIVGMLTGKQIETIIRNDELFSNLVYVIYDPMAKSCTQS